VADGGRVFVRYADLLDDWTKVVMRVGEQLQLEHVMHARSEAIRDGHRFVDPSLRRMTQTLDDLGLPPRLHELTAQTWEELSRLAEPGGDTPEAHAVLDQLREGYVDLYEEAEAISRSSVVAAEQRTRKQLRGGGRPAPAGEPVGVDKIPHGIRAAVPAPVRRGIRRMLGRSR
jgi:hypothetical protein